jgi:putative hydrolase of the HAD superfamily
LHEHGTEPKKTAMIQDLGRKLEVPHALGMTTVLVPPATREVREGWELSGRDALHVDHGNGDLAGFLRKIRSA